MNTLTYSVLASVLLLSPVTAQHKAPKSQVQRIVDQLNLTPDQKAKVDPFLEEDATKVRALRDDSSLSAEDRKKKSAEIRKGTVAKLKPILTEEQWKQFEQLREERQKQSKNKKK